MHTRSSDHDFNAPGHVHARVTSAWLSQSESGLNSLFVVVEFVYGLMGNSVALIADAGHNLSDVLGLAIAWIATALARQPPSKHYTYGLRSSSILAALFNAMFLLTTIGAIAWEAILTFWPSAAHGWQNRDDYRGPRHCHQWHYRIDVRVRTSQTSIFVGLFCTWRLMPPSQSVCFWLVALFS